MSTESYGALAFAGTSGRRAPCCGGCGAGQAGSPRLVPCANQAIFGRHGDGFGRARQGQRIGGRTGGPVGAGNGNRACFRSSIVFSVYCLRQPMEFRSHGDSHGQRGRDHRTFLRIRLPRCPGFHALPCPAGPERGPSIGCGKRIQKTRTRSGMWCSSRTLENSKDLPKCMSPENARGRTRPRKKPQAGTLPFRKSHPTTVGETAFFLANTTGNEKNASIVFGDGRTVSINIGPNAHARFLVRELFGGAAQPGIGSAVVKNADGLAPWRKPLRTQRKKRCAPFFSRTTLLRGSILRTCPTGADGPAAFRSSIRAMAGATWRSKATMRPGPCFLPSRRARWGPARNTPRLFRTCGCRKTPRGFPSSRTMWWRASKFFPMETCWPAIAFLERSSRKRLLAPVETDGATGLVLVNTANFAAQVVLECRDDSGALVARESLAMSAREKKSGTAQAFFSADIGGCATVFYTSDRNLAGFRLNASSDGAMLDALPVLPATP